MDGDIKFCANDIYPSFSAYVCGILYDVAIRFLRMKRYNREAMTSNFSMCLFMTKAQCKTGTFYKDRAYQYQALVLEFCGLKKSMIIQRNF